MEAPAENKKGLSNKVIIIAAAVIIALLAAVVVLLLTRPAPTDIGDEGVPKIGYATEATVRPELFAGGHGRGDGQRQGWKYWVVLPERRDQQ